MTACFGGRLPVLMAGDLNAKHVDWNSRLNSRRGKLLRDYADENSCLILGPDSPATNPYNPLVTPDVLDIVITKKLSFPVYRTSCTALSSDHLPVLNETSCRSSVYHPPDSPDVRRSDWANFQTHLEQLIPFYPELHNEKAIDSCVRTSPAPSWRLWQRQLPSVARLTTHGLRYQQAFRMRYAWKTGCGDSGRSPGTSLWKPRSTTSGGRWPAGSTSGETTSGALHSNPSILKTNRYRGWPSGWWEFLIHFPLVTPGGIALSDREKTEAFADNLEAQFQPVTDPSVPAVIDTADVALRSYLISPSSEPQLTTPDEVQEAIRGLEVSKALVPNIIPNRALKHLPKRAISLLARIFNAVLRTEGWPRRLTRKPRAAGGSRPVEAIDCDGQLD